MKSNTLLFSSLEANSKVSTHCSNLMIGRKEKKNSGETTADPEMALGSHYYRLPLKSIL